METDALEEDKVVIPREEYEKLITKVDNLSRTVQNLLIENQELRFKQFAAECIETVEESPRKIPKTNNQHTDLGNCAASAVFDNNLKKAKKNTTCVINNVSQSDKANSLLKKNKIFQVIGNNAVGVRNHILAAGCKEFVIKQSNGNAPVKINVTANEAKKVKSALLENKSSFHEYKLPDEKSSCFLIRGLVGISELDLDEIKAELIVRGLPENISLSFFITEAMRNNINQNKSSLLKLVLPPKSDVSVLHQIKCLNYVAIKFEAFKSKNVIQCHNCQRFGHASSGCQHPHRCVKCGKNHLKEDCPRSTDKSHKLSCCNCGGDHTANNLAACNFFNEFVAKKASAVKTIVPDRVINKNKSIRRRPELTFSDVVNAGETTTVDVRTSVSKLKNLESKLDKLLSMVDRHDKLLSKLFTNV